MMSTSVEQGLAVMQPRGYFRDEEALGKGRNMARKGSSKPQASVLRAATAINGRIVPTVEETGPEFDESMAPIPEHILEQMPDDLLNGSASTGIKRAAFDRGANGEAESEQLAETDEEISFEPVQSDFALED